MQYINLKNKKGFTLIEVMIASGLFVVLMVFGVAAVLNTNVLFKKNQSQRAVLDNMAFIVEDMARLMRTGYNFRCQPGQPQLTSEDPESCMYSLPSQFIGFEKFDGAPGDVTDQIVYGFYEDGIYRSENGGVSLTSPNPENRKFKLTPDNIEILAGSGFFVRGAESYTDSGDREQPIIFIRLVGQIEDPQEGFVTPFNYQLAITPRRIDS
jgi:prepilin-type N-terminal cleavage/methylation domain-containing protein